MFIGSAQNQNPKVSVIMLNWNGQKLLGTSLSCLKNQTYKNFEVILVDNGSTDNSVKYIKDNFPEFKLIELKNNTGFAAGNNIAYKIISPDSKYILTLNNDTKFENDFVEKFVILAEENQQYGSFAPKMKFFYEKNLIDNCGIALGRDGSGLNRGSKEIDNGQYNKEEEIFGPCAGAALYRREIIDQIGFFDEDFFAYYEDLDLAWRMRHAGYRCLYTPDILVKHVHSATGGSHSPFKAFYMQRNRLFVIVKNFSFGRALWALFPLTIWRYYHFARSAFIIKKGGTSKLKEKTGLKTLVIITLKAWINFFYYLPKMILKSWKIKKENPSAWLKNFSVDFRKMIYS